MSKRFRGYEKPRRAARRLYFEPLEARHLLAVFTVNSLGDEPDSGAVPGTCDTELNPDANPPVPASGDCTLRAALESALEATGADTIEFDASRVPVGAIIHSTGGLTASDVTINGPVGRIEIRATPAGASEAGVVLGGDGGSTLRNLVITGFADGVFITSHDNTVIGNYIGLNQAGSAAAGNAVGVRILASDNNLIGGATEDDRNVISGNLEGIEVISTNEGRAQFNRIQGNYIGTSADGTTAVPNTTAGVRIVSGRDNLIGGQGTRGNVISGNERGILIEDSRNMVAGNRIGLQAGSTLALGNKQGVLVLGSSNCIGGPLPISSGVPISCQPTDDGAQTIVGNTISGSTGDLPNGLRGYGVHIFGGQAGNNVVQGNRIGTTPDGEFAAPNMSDGVLIQEASGNLIGGTGLAQRNIISANNGDGVTIIGSEDQQARNNVVIGNLIGLDAAGAEALANGSRGVHLDQHTFGNRVGGGSEEEINVISGNNLDGVVMALGTDTENVVQGNLIGLNEAGTSSVANGGHGIWIFESSGNIVGQSAELVFAGNAIAGNSGDGIRIEGGGSTANKIAGNLIGVAPGGEQRLSNQGNGVAIVDAADNEVGGVLPGEGNTISGNAGAGVLIQGGNAQGNTVLGNRIGTDFEGNATDLDGVPGSLDELGNGVAGVRIDNAPDNLIGFRLNPLTSGPNIISGNPVGVLISGEQSTANLVGSNFIGVNANGTKPLGNATEGVRIQEASGNYVGGQTDEGVLVPGNVISANEYGVAIVGTAALPSVGNVVAGNRIGTDSVGDPSDPESTERLGNKKAGVLIDAALGNFIGPEIAFNEVCEPAANLGNTIAGNLGPGVVVEGDAAVDNSIRCNSIAFNDRIGIDLSNDSVTSNDPMDADRRANMLQNYPIIALLERLDNSTKVSGTLSATPNSTFTIDFYATDTTMARGVKDVIQGGRYLGSKMVETDDLGYVHFTTDSELSHVSPIEVITATATDPLGNTSEFGNFTPDFKKADGEEIRTPVIFVPGFFGSFVPPGPGNDGFYATFLSTLGVKPHELLPDPIQRGYDDILQTLLNAGYRRDTDLFAAPYDWRLPIAPAGGLSERDGQIELTAATITDDVFEYGVDYLGAALKNAAEEWFRIHDVPLTNVHLVAHSMGGLVSRAYVQSTAYGGSFETARGRDGSLPLPAVSNLTMLGTPNRGAAVTFAPWDDNFSGSLAYQTVLSKVISHAWKYMKTFGFPVFDSAGNLVIDPDTIDFDATGLALHDEKVRFLRQYVKGLGDLLPEYEGYQNGFNTPPEFENALLLDLNRQVLSPSRVARTIAIYGTSASTHTFVNRFVGTEETSLPVLVSFTDLLPSMAEDDQVWYLDEDVEHNGDGTVPLQSLEGLFQNDARVELFPYCSAACRPSDRLTTDSIEHTKIVANTDVQLQVLETLGHVIEREDISTGLSAGDGEVTANFAIPVNQLNLALDPVDALLVDGAGNRFGYTQATGPLAEIPGSVWFGDRTGIGWVLGNPVGVLELRLFGLGEDYSVQVTSELGGAINGQVYEGTLGIGETLILPVPGIVRGLGGVPEFRVSGAGQQVDLTRLAEDQLAEIGRVNIIGSGRNSLTLNAESVRHSSGELLVRANLDDRVELGGGWRLTGAAIREGVFFRRLEQGDAQLSLSGPADHQNPVLSLDVNNDSHISPVDALITVNEQNARILSDSTGRVLDPVSLASDGDPSNDFDDFYRDVDGDGFVVPLDTLAIINFLNDTPPDSEGESPHAGVSLVLSDAAIPLPLTKPKRQTSLVVKGLHGPPAWSGDVSNVAWPERDEFITVVDLLAAEDDLVDLGLDNCIDVAGLTEPPKTNR